MFGTYQHSDLRIEIDASAEKIRESLTEPERLRQWLWPQQIKLSNRKTVLTTKLVEGQFFESGLGPAKVGHKVERLSADGIRFLLSGSIDGFHEWQWGDGWIQSRLEGVSLLPLNLGQTVSLLRLKQYLQQSAHG
ncbi:MAG: hypothetical protein WA885_19020 [Phormidesmis sp.]